MDDFHTDQSTTLDFKGEGNAPIGVALWAWLNEEAENQLDKPPGRLKPDQWKSGDQLWLVEMVAPGATQQNMLRETMVADLLKTSLKNKSFKYHHNDPALKKREVRVFPE